jgi:hypothetical protein
MKWENIISTIILSTSYSALLTNGRHQRMEFLFFFAAKITVQLP